MSITLGTLAEIGDAQVSWRALGDAIRTRVRQTFPQRPLVEGPVKRLLFSLSEVDPASIPVAVQGGLLRLGAGRITGVSVGDVYGVTGVGAAGFTAGAAIARIRVEHVEALHAIARPIAWCSDSDAIPQGAMAWPLELALARHPVWIDAPEIEHASGEPAGEDACARNDRAALEKAIEGSARLRVATAPRQSVVGELRVRGGELLVFAQDGRALEPDARPWSIPDAIRQIDQLAAAQALVELEGEHGLSADDVEVEWGTVHGGGVRIARPEHGVALGLGDRFYVRLRNRLQGQQRFAHVFYVDLCGEISLLSHYAPAGIRLGPEQEALVGIGPDPSSPTNGYPLRWPRGAPRDEPGTATLFVIVTKEAVELRALETAHEEGAGRGAGRRCSGW